MLSMDLAKLYGVPAMRLEEYENLKSQIAISSWGGARRANPYAFTEQGIAMLLSR